MSFFKLSGFLALFCFIPLSAVGAGFTGNAERLLENADRVLFPADTSFLMELSVRNEDRKSLEYVLKGYSSADDKQRVVWLKPDIDKNDQAIKNGDLITFKYAKWSRADSLSAKSSLLDSPFSWEDALCIGLSRGYQAENTVLTNLNGQELVQVILKPKRPSLYTRLDLWLNAGSLQTVKREYYTPSGRIYKVASYSNYQMSQGRAMSFELTLENLFTGATAVMKYSQIRPERKPPSYFNPENLKKEKPHD